MSSNVTSLLFVLFFVFIGIFIAVTWIRWAVENVRFATSMYEAWKVAKQRWQAQRVSQSGGPPQPPALPGAGGARPGPTSGPGDGPGDLEP